LRSSLLPLSSEMSPPRSGWWHILRRILIVAVALVIAGIWALVGPLPSHMGKARADWFAAQDDPHAPSSFDSAGGTLTSTGASGDWTIHATSCTSGQPWGAFYGVNLADRSNAGLATRIVLPESGEDHVTVKVPGAQKDFRFDRSACSVWDVDIHFDGTVANSIYELAGHARLDCSQNGAHIAANLDLRRCNY
jgi:hypothetical protein